MKVTRIAQGQYKVCVHGHDFVLERLYGSKNWTLWNSKSTEVNTTETKSGMLELMSSWSEVYAAREAGADVCSYT